jgi:hypothetical protein
MTPPIADPYRAIVDEIQMLKAEQEKVRAARDEIRKKLRDAERRKRRLETHANQLSDTDLLTVVSLRNHEKAQGNHGPASEEKDDESDSTQEVDTSGAIIGASSSVPPADPVPHKKARFRNSIPPSWYPRP